MAGLQNLSNTGEAAGLGATRYSGLTFTIDGTTASTLDIAATASSSATLADGTFLTPGSFTAAQYQVTGNTVTGSYYLWLDYTSNSASILYNLGPTFTTALTSAAAPSTSAIIVATFAVAASVITTGTLFPVSGQYQSRVISWGGTDLDQATGTRTVGFLPAGAVIDDIVVNVTTVSNATTTSTVSVGKAAGSATTQFLNTVDTKTTAGRVAITTKGTFGPVGATAVTLTYTHAQTGGAGTLGVWTISVFWHAS